jgi:esterase FrsA
MTTELFQGLPPALAARIPYFTTSGISSDILAKAMKEAGGDKGPAHPEWAHILITYGQRALGNKDELIKQEDHERASKAYREASFWFFLARFPYVSNEITSQAYQLHLQAYKNSLEGTSFPLTEIFIPFQDHSIRTFLRMPTTQGSSVPLVILWGGLDVWKSDLEINHQSELLLKQGFATLTIDIPGTGECPPFKVLQGEQWFLTVIEFMKANPKIDPSRIACYGLSFGGYWATKLSLISVDLMAAVNIGGPAHLTFTQEWISKLPLMTKMALGSMVGVDAIKEPGMFVEVLESFSLFNQKFLPTKNNIPLLCINGEKDEVVPIQEFTFLQENGVQQDTLTFTNDRHVASKNASLRDLCVTHWLLEKCKNEISQ